VTFNPRKTGNISLLVGSVVWIAQQHKTEASGLHGNENKKQDDYLDIQLTNQIAVSVE